MAAITQAVTLLGKFGDIFSMILIFVIVYGLLQYTKVLGDNKNLHAAFAFVVALLILFMPNLALAIRTMVPWLIFFGIFIMLVLMLYKTFGVTDAQIVKTMYSRNYIANWVIILSIIIAIGALGSVYFTGNSDTGVNVDVKNVTLTTGGEVTQTGTAAFWATIYHPKVLGLIVVMIIGGMSITLLTSPVKVR